MPTSLSRSSLYDACMHPPMPPPHRLPRSPVFWLVALAGAIAGLTLAGCPAPPSSRSETLDPATLPQEVRADYEVFAQRCSKCHSLARPLNSGITDDGYWAMYVARMRRQPASGISVEDGRVILRFLHYYSLEELRKKGGHGAERPVEDTPPPASVPDAKRGDAG
jgi:hypothetical protein